MANKVFGSILRELRKEKGLTQQEVSDYLGLKNKSTMGSWEVGKSEPDAYTLLRLLQLYEVSNIYDAFSELLGDVPDPSPADTRLAVLTYNYRAMNETGQKKVVEYSDDLLRTGQYFKRSPLDLA